MSVDKFRVSKSPLSIRRPKNSIKNVRQDDSPVKLHRSPFRGVY